MLRIHAPLDSSISFRISGTTDLTLSLTGNKRRIALVTAIICLLGEGVFPDDAPQRQIPGYTFPGFAADFGDLWS